MAQMLDACPQRWTKEDVHHWITWCSDEYSLNLESTQFDKFSMNGKALLMLKKEDFCDRIPSVGDVLYNVLQNLSGACLVPSLCVRQPIHFPLTLYPQHHSPPPLDGAWMKHTTITNNEGFSFMGVPPPTFCPPLSPHQPASTPVSPLEYKPFGFQKHVTDEQPMPALLPIRENKVNQHLLGIVELKTECGDCNLTESPKSFDHVDAASLPPKKRQLKAEPTVFEAPSQPDVTKDNEAPRSPPPKHKQITLANNKLLWEFISELLQMPKRLMPVKWIEETSLTFRITDPQMLAEMWGQQKQKCNMNYEKLSRALRYYYSMKIISKVQGKKLTYRFSTPPDRIKKGIRGAKPGVPHKRRKKDGEDSKPKDAKKHNPNEVALALDLSVKSKESASKSRTKKRKGHIIKACSKPSSISSDSGIETDFKKVQFEAVGNETPVMNGICAPQLPISHTAMTMTTDCLDLSSNKQPLQINGYLQNTNSTKLHQESHTLTDLNGNHNLTRVYPTLLRDPFHSGPSAFSPVKRTSPIISSTSDNYTLL